MVVKVEDVDALNPGRPAYPISEASIHEMDLLRDY